MIGVGVPRTWKELSPLFALFAQALAFWPVWRWYALRLAEPGGEVWGLAALAGAFWVVVSGRGGANDEADDGANDRYKPSTRKVMAIGWLPVAATGAYAAAFPFLSPLPRAILAVMAMGLLLPGLGLRRHTALHAAGFLFLSMPIMPSLQFYLGYPLRIVSGEAAARVINLSGFPVVREGALLAWRDHTVFIDAPCSGVKMLWAGLMLAWTLCAIRRDGPLRTLAMAAVAVGAVVAGNILRTTALFFLETGVVRGPVWVHSAIGLVAFIAVAGLIARPGATRRAPLAIPAREAMPCVP